MRELCLVTFAVLVSVTGALAGEGQRNDGAAVAFFARDGGDAMVAAELESKVRHLYRQYAKSQSAAPSPIELELRFDVGNLRKSDLGKSQMQFYKAQRSLAKGDIDEAKDHLFRAKRFYNKALPYSSDPEFLSELLYYSRMTKEMAGREEEARTLYCEYIALKHALYGGGDALEKNEVLLDICKGTPALGRGTVKVSSNVDGAHLYVDGREVGVVGRKAPVSIDGLPCGPRLVELRKIGYSRWGKMVTIKKGAVVKARGKLRTARSVVRNQEYDPLNELAFEGDNASSDEYIEDLMFRFGETFGVEELFIGYVFAPVGQSQRLVVFWSGADELERFELAYPIGNEGGNDPIVELWAKKRGAPSGESAGAAQAQSGELTVFKVE